jgi:hypothetical protein
MPTEHVLPRHCSEVLQHRTKYHCFAKQWPITCFVVLEHCTKVLHAELRCLGYITLKQQLLPAYRMTDGAADDMLKSEY